MAALPAALDALAQTAFNTMTSKTARDALKEITKMPNEAVIQKEVQRLDEAQRDTLMKVVYCGLANDPGSSAVLLKWHAELFAVAGPGAIVRTLTDKAPAGAAVAAAAK